MTILFSLSSFLVFPFWLLIIGFPLWRWTLRIMQSPFVSAAPALVYLILTLPILSRVEQVVLSPSLSKVAVLLGTQEGAFIAWVHFLAFDLFVGRWIYLDSRELHVHPLLMAPILFMTLMLGPVGFLLYLSVRSVYQFTQRNAVLQNDLRTTL